MFISTVFAATKRHGNKAAQHTSLAGPGVQNNGDDLGSLGGMLEQHERCEAAPFSSSGDSSETGPGSVPPAPSPSIVVARWPLRQLPAELQRRADPARNTQETQTP